MKKVSQTKKTYCLTNDYQNKKIKKVDLNFIRLITYYIPEFCKICILIRSLSKISKVKLGNSRKLIL